MRGLFPRYIFKEIWPLYAAGVLLFLFLQMTDILSTTVGAMLSYHTGLFKALTLLSYQLPLVLNKCLVVSVPFAVLMAFGRLAKDSEVKAAYAGGVRPLSMLWPLLLPALVVGAAVYFNAAYLTPSGNQKYIKYFYTDIYKLAVPTPTTQNYAHAEGGNFFTAGRIDSLGNGSPQTLSSLTGVVVQTPQGTYSASGGRWDAAAKTWTLFGGYRVDPQGVITALSAPITFTQSDVVSRPPPPTDQSTTPQLRAQLATLTPNTEDYRRAAYELSRRVADSFTPLIFVLAAGTLGLALTNRAWAVGAVILFLVTFYALWNTAPQLAAVGALPHLLAAWLPNLVFALFGLLMAWRLR
ncbi:YjgP/YjgQ family permease [Deinococcus detaillensis]|uniref:YjgP/YjgQ family permease n=1 Tax=Deinococcus detaillensis TaxID=2592048 RepID=A0A553V2D0_9DEIO|nr:LptF/LptG family permease [Deinococcus detaillensis]TSA86391.1 YjgP/YjgQ family permease [Deinococcus detaillensis]